MEPRTHKKPPDGSFCPENPDSSLEWLAFPQHSLGLPPRTLAPYLAVQLPGSVVLLSTASVENGLVVHFDQLPFGAVAEVPKHPADDTDTHNNSNADSYNHG